MQHKRASFTSVLFSSAVQRLWRLLPQVRTSSCACINPLFSSVYFYKSYIEVWIIDKEWNVGFFLLLFFIIIIYSNLWIVHMCVTLLYSAVLWGLTGMPWGPELELNLKCGFSCQSSVICNFITNWVLVNGLFGYCKACITDMESMIFVIFVFLIFYETEKQGRVKAWLD